MVGGHDVHTIKRKNERNMVIRVKLTEIKVLIWVSFWPSINLKELKEFNPSSRFHKGYPARGLTGSTRLFFFFFFSNKHVWLQKGLPFAVIQPGWESNPGPGKGALISKVVAWAGSHLTQQKSRDFGGTEHPHCPRFLRCRDNFQSYSEWS